MRQYLVKTRYILPTYLLIILITIAGFGVIRWIIDIELKWFRNQVEYFEFYFPIALSVLTSYIWLYPKFKNIIYFRTPFYENYAFIYGFLCAVSIFIPTMLFQQYQTSGDPDLVTQTVVSIFLGIVLLFLLLLPFRLDEKACELVETTPLKLHPFTPEKELKYILPTKENKLIYFIVVANVLMFILFSLSLKNDDSITNALLVMGANSKSLVFDQGEWFRLITSLFLHYDFVHLISNMGCLAYISILIIEVFDKKEFLLIYFLAGIIGNFFSVLLRQPTIAFGLGASGSVFGLFGSLVALLFLDTGEKYHKNIFIFVGGYAFFSFISLSGNEVDIQQNIDYTAHFFGFFSGALIGYFIYSKKNKIADEDEISKKTTD